MNGIKGFSLNHLFREEKGNVLAMVALCLVALLGVTAFAVDVGYLQWQKGHLQNTADAAAIAGAIEAAYHDPSNVRQTVEAYVAEHGVDLGDIVDVDINFVDGSVEVELRGNRPLFFARVLGFNQAGVAAKARAGWTAGAGGGGNGNGGGLGPVDDIAGMSGLIPIGIPESVFEAKEEGEQIEVITFQMTFGPGNWGWISFEGTGNQFNPNTIAGHIRDGYPETVNIGDPIQTRVGTSNPRMRNEIDAHISGGTVLYAPVVEDGAGSGTTEFTIVGFAAIVLINRTGNPAFSTITANVVEGEWPSGGIDLLD